MDSKFKLNFKFDLNLEVQEKQKKFSRKTKITKPKVLKVVAPKAKPARPSPKFKSETVISKVVSPKVSKPKQSWDGLQELPPIILLDEDFADIENQFIVDFNFDAFKAAGLDLSTISPTNLAARLGLEVSQIRSIQRRFLFSAVLKVTPQQAGLLSKNPLVKVVEADSQIKAAGNELPLSWGLDRLDSPSLPLDSHFDRDFGEYQTRVYLFDTAVEQASNEFGNRVKFGASFVKPATDKTIKCREHGTEMASLIAGQTTGSAPKTEIVQLVVLPCERKRSGEASSLIEAVEWLLVREADYGDEKPAIANMSLAGKWSRKINQAVSILTDYQVAVVVAAGNNSQDACRFSPASAKDAITVAATGPNDETPGFSNFGSCVDVNAPGRLLTALTEGKPQQYIASNGTSGAAALVSGLLARSLQKKGPNAAENWLAKASVPSKLWRKSQPEMLLAQVNPDISSYCRVAVEKSELNVLVNPESGSKTLRSLSNGSIVRVEKVEADWVQIAIFGGNKGWIPKYSTMLELEDNIACKILHRVDFGSMR